MLVMAAQVFFMGVVNFKDWKIGVGTFGTTTAALWTTKYLSIGLRCLLLFTVHRLAVVLVLRQCKFDTG
jgi:hypothetical protein